MRECTHVFVVVVILIYLKQCNHLLFTENTLGINCIDFIPFGLEFLLRWLNTANFLFQFFHFTLCYSNLNRSLHYSNTLNLYHNNSWQFCTGLVKVRVFWLVAIPRGQLILDKWEHSHTLVGKVVWHSHSGRKISNIFHKLKCTYPVSNFLRANTSNKKYERNHE